LLCRLLGLHITCIYPKQTCTNPSKFSAFAKVCYVYFLTQIYTLFLKKREQNFIPHAPTEAESFANLDSQPQAGKSD
jgi:hypothetical protein